MDRAVLLAVPSSKNAADKHPTPVNMMQKTYKVLRPMWSIVIFIIGQHIGGRRVKS